MITVVGKNQKIEIAMGGAFATVAPDFDVSFSEYRNNGQRLLHEYGSLVDATYQTLLTAPEEDNWTRFVNTIYIVNNDSASVVINVRLNDGVVTKFIWKATLATGEKLLYLNTGEWVLKDITGRTKIPVSTGGGAAAFIDLTDVPASYAGHALKLVRVNVTEDGLEFIDL